VYMRICVFGAGALGSALGGMLARENDVFLVGRKPHVEAIRKRGLVLQGDLRRTVRLPAFTDVTRVAPPELLLITTKAYDTGGAIVECGPWVTDKTAVLTLQNGLGNLEALREWKGSKAFAGTTTLGSTMVSPGKVRISGLGRTMIGSELDPAYSEKIVGVFADSGIPSRFSKNMLPEMWAKAIVSACINPLTAILRVPNGRLLESRVISRMVLEVSKECERVARAHGIELSQSHMYPHVRAVAMDTARNLSSMLQDVLRGNRTEIDQINGLIWRLSEEHGLDSPLNKTLSAMVQSLEPHSSRKVNIRT
jgi:2-dehydropantoate 2-reductase